jgi:signal transduction histidine kinase
MLWSIAGLRGEPQAYPGPADFAYLAGYVTLFFGVARLSSGGARADRAVRWYLDVAIGTIAVGLVAWHAFLGDAVAGAITAGTLIERTVSVLYPLLDLLNLTGLMLLAIRPTKYHRDPSVIALGAGLGFLIIADALYFRQVAAGTYWPGNSVNSLWFLWHTGLAVSGAALGAARRASPRSDRYRSWALIPTYGAVLFLIASHLVDTIRGEAHTFTDIGTVAVMFLVVVRQTVAIREGRREVETHRRNLVASVSHELRTPLAAIYGFTDLLNDGSIPPEEQRDVIRIVHEQTGHLNRIVADLVAVARGSLGRTSLDRTVVELGPILSDAIAVTGIEGDVRVELEPDLRLECDPLRIRQVLVNLISNGAKYGGSKMLVVAARSGTEVEVAVHDGGLGIPRRFQEAIWHEFERGAHRTDERTPGSGLGLAIARSLARAHGGDITYRQSERLGGACFALTLPIEAR